MVQLDQIRSKALRYHTFVSLSQFLTADALVTQTYHTEEKNEHKLIILCII